MHSAQILLISIADTNLEIQFKQKGIMVVADIQVGKFDKFVKAIQKSVSVYK